MSEWVTVARADELAPGEWRVADVGGAQIAVFNLDGHYYAIEDVCTHDGGQLTGGSVEGDHHFPRAHRKRRGPGTRQPLGLIQALNPLKQRNSHGRLR